MVTKHADAGVVERNWDPITRIIGSLGVYHQDQFQEQRKGCRVSHHLFDFPRLQRLHQEQGPARRPLHHQPHLRHLRRQPRDLLGATPRTWPTACTRRHIGRADRQPRRGRRVHVRPQHLPGEPGRRGLLREDGRARPTPVCWSRPTHTESPHAGDARLRHDRRHHARRSTRSPATFYRRGASQVSRWTREMFCLMEGRHVRPVDAVPRWRRHRRPRSSCSPTTTPA